nr:hypothetical protein [Herbaspirillum sp. ASV7]
MMSDLRIGDRLTLPGNPDSYLEVLDARIHAGTIHIFDACMDPTPFASSFCNVETVCVHVSGLLVG